MSAAIKKRDKPLTLRRLVRRQLKRVRRFLARLKAKALWGAVFLIAIVSGRPLSPLRLFSPSALTKAVIGHGTYCRLPQDCFVVGDHKLDRPKYSYVPFSYIASVSDAVVSGQSSMVIVEKHQLILPSEDLLPPERPVNFSNQLVRRGSSFIARVNPRLRTNRSLREAILISSRLSFNYAHFVIEALQAFLMAEELLPHYRGPILVAFASRQCRALLKLVAPDRQFVFLEPEDWCGVATLHIAVIGAYSPETPGNTLRSGYEMAYLVRLRERVTAAVPDDSRGANIVFVSRRKLSQGVHRDVTNSLELEEYVRSIGGAVIFPEEMEISDQIRTYRGADILIAAGGAALASLVFCRPGTACICLHQDRHINPWYYSDLASELGVRWISIVGPGQAQPSADGVTHARFSISLNTLRSVISDLTSHRRNEDGNGAARD